VRAASTEMGDNEGAIDATVIGGQAAIAFNSHYLRDALEAIGTRRVRLEVNSPSQPGVLRPVGLESEHALIHVVMPLSVGR
jgi:DNA polymerase III subunit beta